MKRLTRATPLVLALLASSLSPSLGRAQGPTPEGTVVTNTATARWSDANGNSYDPVAATASITVGFLAGIDVTAPAELTPASPSTGNVATFVIRNVGNGTDTLYVSSNGWLDEGFVAEQMTIDGVPHEIAEGFSTLHGMALAAGATVTVTVPFDVDGARGGWTTSMSLVIASMREPGVSDEAVVVIRPVVSRSVTTTALESVVERLPSNGVVYTAQFRVENHGNAYETSWMGAASASGILAIVSVHGAAGNGAWVEVPAGESRVVDVRYTVGAAEAGASATLDVEVTPAGWESHGASQTVTVAEARIELAHAVYDGASPTPAATPLAGDPRPGDHLWYRFSLSNSGTAPVHGLVVSDTLPAGVVHVSDVGGDPTPGTFTMSRVGNVVTATLPGTLPPGESRVFWVRVRID